MKRVLTIALVMGLAVLTAGAADLKIGVISPLSGPVPSFGLSTKEGYLLAIQEWNAKGGVLGQKIVPSSRTASATRPRPSTQPTS